MAREIPCSECGELGWPTASKADRICQPCRRLRHGTRLQYKVNKCRCDECRAWNRDQTRDYVKAFKDRNGFSPTQKYRPPRRIPCSDCGVVLKSGQGAEAPRCKSCLLAHRGLRRRLANRRARVARKAARAAMGMPSSEGSWISGSCNRCGDGFTRKGAASPYCSGACRRKDRKAFVSGLVRSEIYARDGWCCQLCMEPVEKNLDYLDPWSATLDHVVPQSKGGTHDAENLRLAHRWCNSVRGDETYYTEADLRVAS